MSGGEDSYTETPLQLASAAGRYAAAALQQQPPPPPPATPRGPPGRGSSQTCGHMPRSLKQARIRLLLGPWGLPLTLFIRLSMELGNWTAARRGAR